MVAAWAVQDGPNPDEYTVNIQASIMEAYCLIQALGQGAILSSSQGRKELASIAYYMAEDIAVQLNKIGGFAAAVRLAKEKSEGTS
jgi:hypothetical protein